MFHLQVIESDEEEIETSETVDNQIDLEDDGQGELSSRSYGCHSQQLNSCVLQKK